MNGDGLVALVGGEKPTLTQPPELAAWHMLVAVAGSKAVALVWDVGQDTYELLSIIPLNEAGHVFGTEFAPSVLYPPILAAFECYHTEMKRVGEPLTIDLFGEGE